MQHLQKPIPNMGSDLARFQPLIDRLLCKDRDGRFPDAEAMVDYVLDVYEQESKAGAGPAAEHKTSHATSEPARFNKRSLALALGGVVSLSIGFTGIYLYSESLKSTNIVVKRAPSAEQPPASSGLDTLTGLGRTADTLPAQVNVKREDVMKALGGLGQHSLQRGRLTSPPADNAYYYFSRLLALDANNQEALDGFEQIAERYIQLAERQYASKNDLQAQVYITLGLQVDPDNEGLLTLQSIVKDRKRSFWDAITGLFSGH